MAEQHRRAGKLGGQTTVERYGVEHMRAIGRLGGRPTWQATVEKDRRRRQEALARVREDKQNNRKRK